MLKRLRLVGLVATAFLCPFVSSSQVDLRLDYHVDVFLDDDITQREYVFTDLESQDVFTLIVAANQHVLLREHWETTEDSSRCVLEVFEHSETLYTTDLEVSIPLFDVQYNASDSVIYRIDQPGPEDDDQLFPLYKMERQAFMQMVDSVSMSYLLAWNWENLNINDYSPTKKVLVTKGPDQAIRREEFGLPESPLKLEISLRARDNTWVYSTSSPFGENEIEYEQTDEEGTLSAYRLLGEEKLLLRELELEGDTIFQQTGLVMQRSAVGLVSDYPTPLAYLQASAAYVETGSYSQAYRSESAVFYSGNLAGSWPRHTYDELGRRVKTVHSLHSSPSHSIARIAISLPAHIELRYSYP